MNGNGNVVTFETIISASLPGDSLVLKLSSDRRTQFFVSAAEKSV